MNNQQTELTIDQKLALLNGLETVNLERHSDDEFSLYVKNTPKTLITLEKIGLTEEEIAATASMCDSNVRDIAIVGFQIGADCYDPSAGWRLWTVDEKLEMLNELEFVDDYSDGETLYYATVEYNDKTRETLENLGIDPDEYKQDDCIDISKVAWAIGATWYDGKRFLVDRPELVGGGKPVDQA